MCSFPELLNNDPTVAADVLPYSGKFSRDKIFADGSKNDNSRIKFSRMLARVTRQNSENA